MTGPRRLRRVLWVLVGLAAMLAGALALGWWRVDGPGAAVAGGGRETGVAAIGGPFVMTDQRGRRFTEADLRGRPALLVFGFTACPDICPTTLAEMSAWLAALGPDGDRLRAVFVTVDPERDDVTQLAAYLSAFDPRLIGLTGSPAQLAAMAAAWKAYYKKVDLGGGAYGMDHTTSIYLLDAQGRYAGRLDHAEDRARAVDRLRALLASGS